MNWHCVALSMALTALPSALAGAEVEMTIDTIPTGARVEMGGSEVGTTPLTLQYPPAYFRAPGTAFARYLAAPLVVTLKKDGFPDKTIELGEGPYSWVSLNASNRFEYYLLRRSYLIQLEIADTNTSGAEEILAAVTALEKLAELHERGVLTEEEFNAQKEELLTLSAATGRSSAIELPAALDENAPPVAFCSQFFFAFSKYHEIDAEPVESLVEGASGPVGRCLWLRPSEGVTTLKVSMQCGLKDLDAACERLEDVDRESGPLVCTGSKNGEAAAIYHDGCVALATGAGDAGTVDAQVHRALVSFTRGYDR